MLTNAEWESCFGTTVGKGDDYLVMEEMGMMANEDREESDGGGVQPAITVRKRFPETWIWTDVKSG